jgi:hypothetical protein
MPRARKRDKKAERRCARALDSTAIKRFHRTVVRYLTRGRMFFDEVPTMLFTQPISGSCCGVFADRIRIP